MSIAQKRFLAKIFGTLVLVLLLSSFILLKAATQIDIIPPPGSQSFADTLTLLPNGNFVVTDPNYSILTPRSISSVGAVYLYDPNGNLISAFTGACPNDNVGRGGVTVLANGNFVVSSPDVDLSSTSGIGNCLFGGPLSQDAGATTLGSADTGVSGIISPANSLMGTFLNDQVGQTVALPDGNYLVLSGNTGRGAITWQSGTSFTPQVISAKNSIVGDATSGLAGAQVKILSNGNYVAFSPSWNSNRGFVRFCNALAVCIGTISAENSLVGAAANDRISGGNSNVVPLANGNYAVTSRHWNGRRGAVTLGNGITGTVGEVSASNSLVGSTVNDEIGRGPTTPLTNGGYVVLSPIWDSPTNINAGAATFVNGTSGLIGPVSEQNSLIGSQNDSDFNLAKVVALTNGNYVVVLASAIVPGTPYTGAAVWGSGLSGVSGRLTLTNCMYGGGGDVFPLTNGNFVWGTRFVNGATGSVGPTTESNSLVGSTWEDRVGSGGVTALTNGNYVVNSPSWWNGDAQSAGAVTFCNGMTGRVGPVSTSNSLVGTHSQDGVGAYKTVALSNGNYVAFGIYWDGYRGHATFGDGTNGTIGPVSSSNSLVGTIPYEGLNGVVPLANGNYLATSVYSNTKGAITFGSGTAGVTGVVTEQNSLVGTSQGDAIGNSGITAYPDGTYVVYSGGWDNGGIVNASAVTLGNGSIPLVGQITSANSVLGTLPTTAAAWRYAYDPVRKVLVVGRYSKFVSIFRYSNATISGRITQISGVGVAGVTVSISGSATGQTSTDADGNFSIDAPIKGSYTITPTKAGKIFSPASQTFDGLMIGQTANFTASQALASIAGRVLQQDGRGVTNALVTLTDSNNVPRQSITGRFGNYNFADLPAGQTYNISVTARRFQFTSQSIFLIDSLTSFDIVAQ